jgi:phosphonate transport system substrate-binding protein
MAAYRLGAVAYAPKVDGIWAAFRHWLRARGFPLEYRLFESYPDQERALLEGELDAAWNTNLAYVHVHERTDGACRAIAMRDTDLGWTSSLVVPRDSDVRSLDGLLGRRVGFGDRDSPQAHIIPVHELRRAGIDPRRDMMGSRLDLDVGKHGDTGGAEAAQLRRLRDAELDACVLSSVVLDGLTAAGEADDLRTVWTTSPFHHCNFTVLEGSPADHDSFRELLRSMDAGDPQVCDAMREEYVNRWVAGDETGYGTLLEAVRAGPVLVG